MDNKCNKTPNTNIKYMDHVYCQANDGKNYIRANNNVSGGVGGGSATNNADFLALLKENKQLKAMLILHLDLIQEQSDQLIAKDKELATQREQVETLRTKTTQLESQVQELQKQLQRQIKRVVTAVGEISSLPPPPLAKIQSKIEHPNIPNVINDCNGKIISKIVLHRVNQQQLKREGTSSPLPHSSSEMALDTESGMIEDVSIKQESRSSYDDGEKKEEKSLNQSDEFIETKLELKEETSPLVVLDEKSKESSTMNSSSSPANVTSVCATPPIPSRGKQMPLMLWHATPVHTDESSSCESMLEDDDQCSTVGGSPMPDKSTDDCKNSPSEACQTSHTKPRRCAYISTTQMYCTREWEDEELICDYEFTKEEADALHADAPMLEIPKWTEHDLTVSYCINGTEDLSDDTFLKRHNKLEVDERRRKKWDVQQIREQRRIEKLKRRHCKEEVTSTSDHTSLISFYPPADNIQTICYVTDLPVQAFGEMVPKLPNPCDFTLPWLERSSATDDNAEERSLSTTPIQLPPSPSSIDMGSTNCTGTTSSQEEEDITSSTFILLKKRKRQQSGSGNGTSIKQKLSSSIAKTPPSNSSPIHSTPTMEETTK